MKGFASDNYAGVLPEIMDALHRANKDHAVSYGRDILSEKVRKRFCEVFETEVDVLFAFNGTGANVLSISSAAEPFSSVLCADISHFYNDESTAPETFTGCRFIPVPANRYGKLETAVLEKKIIRKGDIHFAQPGSISITQSTEYGTVYQLEEIKAISALARKHNLYLHMDGARFFNAAASLQVPLAALSTHAGIDILSLGGTKAGMMYGEAVIIFDKALARHIRFRQKQAMQLPSKARFIAAQFDAMLENELWKKSADRSNAMAQLLLQHIKDIDGVKVTMPVEANVVFAVLPEAWIAPLQQEFPFYVWDEVTNEVRLMCAFDTTKKEVNEFAKRLHQLSSTGL